MIRGSCLCGAVRFEVDRVAGPFELCHCSRCRKVSGSAFAAGIYVNREDLRFTKGLESIKTYEAPILRAPPPYRSSFCAQCGSSLPDPLAKSPLVEIPAGALDGDPQLRPDKHIYVDVKSPWFEIADNLPQFDQVEIRKHRSR
jgi:hypothetical protein